ncbi:hypothetical protein VLK31_27455 [Variovorax sp. H27-G14]|uniref:hypothetical protein n=1 Tax=Variovorax sp. H27-G14 TaxID=3111914 RepID=UPI0038FD08B0
MAEQVKSHRFLSPLAGKPATRMSRDKNGLPVFKIRTSVLTPLRAKAVDSIKSFVGGALMLFVVFTVFANDFNWMAGCVVAVPACAVYFMAGWTVTALFRQRTNIEMSVDALVRIGWRLKRYDRRYSHSFVLYVHDKAQDEQRAHEEKIAQAGAKGKVLRLKPYYADSYHVCLMHGTTRRDLVEVYSLKDAELILQRLALCDALLNEAAGMGNAFHGAGDREDRGAGGFGDAGRDHQAAGGF